MLTIPGYQITDRLYQSEHSRIYRARRESDDLPVVLKILNAEYPKPEEIARFRREYQITRDLEIEGVIVVYDLLPHQNTLVMMVEDFGGESLDKILPHRPLKLDEFLRLTIRIAEILGSIHQQHIMHKDINPSNIVWNPETDQLKIIDFGISTTLPREQPEIRSPEMLEGTLAYISPEQTGRMNRAVDYRTDLYSLGATFYQMLTGQLPFQADDPMELVHCHLAKMPLPPSGVSNFNLTAESKIRPESSIPPDSQTKVCTPQIVSAIILKLMAKNAEDRYQSAFGLKADLENLTVSLATRGCLDLSGFTLAQHDFSDRFQIPPKLYGREQEIATLLTAFDRVATLQATTGHPAKSRRTSTEMLLVAGYSGIGKTALVHEIHKPITTKRGYFIEGKFDQYKRNEPYFALIQAFQGLVRQLLAEPQDRLTLWKQKWLEAVGPNGQVIIDVIPEIEIMLGPQPPVPELPPAQTHNRFNYVFQNFVRACAAPGHPLVIFLDDLQWADSPSLGLLELFLTDARTQSMLVIGAYRDNEVSDAHPLMLRLRDIRKAGARVETITLGPLQLEHVEQLLEETLHVGKAPHLISPQERRPLPKGEGALLPLSSQERGPGGELAELILQKTGGNPFFLTQFLHSLHERQLLTFDLGGGGWRWELETIQNANITDNVADLMAGKIQQLPDETQHVLQLAACIGNRFDLFTIAVVHEQSPEETLRQLGNALQDGLIVPLDDAYKYIIAERQEAADERNGSAALRGGDFQFLHDRVQQAAYSLIAEDHKQRLHLGIGQLLRSNLPAPEREERLFEIVDHLNVAKDLITAQQEKTELAQLNLQAGQKAKASAAYQQAFTYLQTGIVLLKMESWQQQYDLMLALYAEAAEAAYLSGSFEEMERLVEVVIENARTVLDRVKVYEVKIECYTALKKSEDAIKTGLRTLELLGLRLSNNPDKLDVWWDFLKVRIALFGKQIKLLEDLPVMTEQHKLAALRIIITMGYAAFSSRRNLLASIALRGIHLMIKYGNSPLSAFSWAGYGLLLCGIVGDIESGYQFGQLALQVLKRFDAKEFKCRTLAVVYHLIVPWKEHPKLTLKYFQEAYQSGLETGDLEYAGIAAFAYCYHSFYIGKDLVCLEQEMLSYSKMLWQLNQEITFWINEISHQTVLNLLKTVGDSCLLTGEAYNEQEILPHHLRKEERNIICHVYCNKQILCYLFGEDQQALENAVETEKHLDGVTAMLTIPLFHFYDSLIRLALFPGVSRPEQKRHLKKVAANQKKMKKWAFHAPMNHLHKWQLVEAERMRVLGKEAEARQYYDRAIAGARENEYLNEESLANELAARFWLEKGKEDFAQLYMKQAHHLYQRWGAKRKVQHLEENYPQLLQTQDGRHLQSGAHHTVTDTTKTDFGELDLTTVIKASQAISSELVLDRLLDTLLHIILENAGSDQGKLLVRQDGAWLIKAVPEAEQEIDPVRPPFPASIINTVARLKEPVVLADATQDTQFYHDAYLQLQRPRSVLCLPLIKQKKLIGILYLENTITAGVFTQQRLELLKLLASQAAISIENALLYDTLEQRVTERTAELIRANQAKTAFLSKMSHDLRTPLNAILGYAQNLRREQSLTGQQAKAVAAIQRSGEQLLWLITDLLDISRIELGKVELHPRPFPFIRFLHNLVENFQSRAKERSLTLALELAPNLPAGVYADEGRLGEILRNLLSNALKFTKKGKVTLRVYKLDELNELDEGDEGDEGGNSNTPPLHHSTTHKFHFEVEDTGIGISEEHRSKIFLEFYQVPGIGAETPGTGLGLAISQQLVRLMGGELSVNSTVGEGSTFWFEIKVPVVDEHHLQGGVHLKSLRINGYRGAPRTILLVDDKEEDRTMLRDTLVPLGFEIMEASNGREALEKLGITPVSQNSPRDTETQSITQEEVSPRDSATPEQKNPSLPDLILMDLRMPDLDGFETTRRIREEEQKAEGRRQKAAPSAQHPAPSTQYPVPSTQVPSTQAPSTQHPVPSTQYPVIVAISASVSEDVQQQSLEAGCDDFLGKPVQVELLLDCLQRHLGLEWIYEENPETVSSPPSAAEGSPPVIPSQKVLKELLELAEGRYLHDIQEFLARLKETDPDLIPFTSRIEQLTDNLQFNQIIEYLTSHIKR